MDRHESTADIDAYNPFLGNALGIPDLGAVRSATIDGRAVAVTFTDGSDHRFHHQWLRHACYCDVCGNPADGIRFTTVVSFDAAIEPAAVEVVDGMLRVEWPDGHRSHFAADWLRHHAYDGDVAARRRSWKPTTWRSDLSDAFPTVSWTEASDGAAGQLGLYELLRDFGVVRVRDLGTELQRTEELAALVGPIHETTVYGRIYDVRAEPVAKLGAKTGMAQAPHIDDAFCYSQPGIDVFHCVVNNGSGGLSTYVDGFAIAESIAVDAPDAFGLLASVPIAHIRRHPGEIDMRNRGPLISLDDHGQLCGIRYFDRALAPLDVAPDLVEPMFDAIRLFNSRMIDPAFVATLRAEPGDGVLIDNHRVMHGRTAFDPSEGRHIRLCHVPRDEFHGRWRELTRALRPSEHDLYLAQGSHNA